MQPDIAERIEDIRNAHRRRRYAMKVQQKVDRAIESFIRLNVTGWRPDMSETERARCNREVMRLIKAARAGEGDPVIAKLVLTTDQARAPFDELRKENEKAMARLAQSLPVWPWIESVKGVGALGLATIVGEAGDLARYPTPAKLWKRLGYAPYDGHAGSTWKRESWRPRSLNAIEWTDVGFNPERYALMEQISESLFKAQWIGAAKTEDGQGRPDGPYGAVYAARRARTAETHPEWTPKHAQMDALRVMMKRFLLDLWEAWGRAGTLMDPITELPAPNDLDAAA